MLKSPDVATLVVPCPFYEATQVLRLESPPVIVALQRIPPTDPGGFAGIAGKLIDLGGWSPAFP